MLSKQEKEKRQEAMVLIMNDIELTEDIRHTLGNKEIYAMRKETIIT